MLHTENSIHNFLLTRVRGDVYNIQIAKSMSKVRTRIAPSPTGFPHVGTDYIALFNLTFDNAHGGDIIPDSYTHLTMPTIRSVVLSVLFLSLQ